MPQNSGEEPAGGNQGGDYIVTPILDGAKGRSDNRGSRDGSALGEPGDPMFTLREGSSHAVAYAIQAGALRENPDAGPDGVGVQIDHAYTLEARSEVQAVAFALRGREGGAAPELGGEVSNALRTPGGGASVPMVATSAVRRLTPRECERLQGFPDDYTLIPWRNGMAPDGPRYKALGNSMAVPVMAWLGRRFEMVDQL